MAKKNLSEISKVTDCDLRQVRPMLTNRLPKKSLHRRALPRLLDSPVPTAIVLLRKASGCSTR